MNAPQPRPPITVNIGRIVLEGVDYGVHQGADFERAFSRELARNLEAAGWTRPPVQVAELQIADRPARDFSPDAFGAQAARALIRGLTNPTLNLSSHEQHR